MTCGYVSHMRSQQQGMGTLQVDCPEGYTGPVTVGYASPTIQAVNYNVIDSALLVKVTASTATPQ